jgi:RNA polymerase sigma-70 factor (ECF subfamily)
MKGLESFFCRCQNDEKELERCRSRLYRVAYAWTHNPSRADDLIQETLTKAWQKRSQLRDGSAGEAWLFSILANCHQDHFRRSRETVEIDSVKLVDEATPESENSEYEIVGRVRAAVAKLPEGQRQVVALVDLEGFRYEEVASILRIPVGTVMSRLCRARNALKARLLNELGTQEATHQGKIWRVK